MDTKKYIELGRKVYTYVKARNEKGEYPTVRELASKYRMTNDAVITLIEDNYDMDYNIGWRVGQNIYVDYYKGNYPIEVTACPPPTCAASLTLPP